MQRCEIIGHIGKDATVNDLGQNQVINFSVAVSESYTNTQGEKVTNTTWYECAKWGNNTVIAQYLKKGQQVFISGKPSARAWQNELGEIKPVLGITVNSIQLLGKYESGSASSEPAPAQSGTNTPNDNNVNEPEGDDALPF